MAETEALVKEIDQDNEYAEAVALHPKARTPNGSPTNRDNESSVQAEWDAALGKRQGT